MIAHDFAFIMNMAENITTNIFIYIIAKFGVVAGK